MNFEIIDKKLFQAQACLREMQLQERRAFNSNNVFEHNHDGFLGACSTVRNLFHQRGGRQKDKAIKDWKSIWENNLTKEQKSLYVHMQDDRDETQHAGQSTRIVKKKELKIGQYYRDDACIMESNAGPPGTVGATVEKAHHVYVIDGVERDVTTVCSDYLKLLQQMVAEAKAANL